LLALCSLILTACGSRISRTPEQYAAEFGGPVADYRAVAALTDCTELDNEFARGQNNLEDTGERAWEGHRDAARQRYDELKCTPP
jgi:hypothetical protein